MNALKRSLLKSILEDVNLDIFLNVGSAKLDLDIKERLISSNFFRHFYNKEIGNLEYLVNSQPYLEGSQIFGRIDICKQTNDRAILVRGWIFNPQHIVQSLTIILNETRYPVLAFHLNRMDVFQQLGFLPNSLNCGFVSILEACDIGLEEVEIGFEVSINEALVSGSFESVRIS